MRTVAWVPAFALVGCASQDDIEVQRCAREAYIPAWDNCIESHNARVAARQDNSDSEDAAAWGLLGATAFMNGYNNARPAVVACYRTGMMTMCQ